MRPPVGRVYRSGGQEKAHRAILNQPLLSSDDSVMVLEKATKDRQKVRTREATTIMTGMAEPAKPPSAIEEQDVSAQRGGAAAAHDSEDVFAAEEILVRTRLRPPFRASGTIHRHRLQEMVAEVRRHTLSLVKAPAGYGKSSVLGQWFDALRRDGFAVGWLSLDSISDDLTGFFRYVLAALQISRPNFGQRMSPLLGLARRPTVVQIKAAFLDAIMDADEDLFLFIDDFHLVEDDEISKTIHSILTNPPHNLHIVLSSRHVPSFSLSSLRSKGNLLEIEGDALRFDNGEAREFLQLAGHRTLLESQVETLVDRTEGWAAGIQLASISLAQKSNTTSFFSFISGSHHHLSEYLADDVLRNLNADTYDFLLSTSVLSRLCPELCDALTGRDNARQQLNLLERQSLFLCSLDNERVWYRYHHLFARFIGQKQIERDPASIVVLHRRASDWFARQGLIEEAFDHAIEAGDMMRAGELLELSCSRLFYKGGLSTILRWSDRIPADTLQKFPRAKLEIAFSIILEWRFDEAAKIIEAVERTISAESRSARDEKGVSIGDVLIHRKMMLNHFMDDTIATERLIQEAIDKFPDGDPYLRGNFETCLVYTWREMYRLQNTDKIDARARGFYEKAGSTFVLVWHEAIMGPTYFLRGDTELAINSLQTAMKIAESLHGGASPLMAIPALLLAEVLYEGNRCAEASALIEKFGGMAETLGFVDQLVSFYVTKTRLLVRAGQMEDAKNTLRQGRLSAEKHGFIRLKRFLELEEVVMAIATTDLDAVKRFLADGSESEREKVLRPGSHTTTRDEAHAVRIARSLSAMGDHAQAIAILRRWTAFAAARGALRSEVRLLIVLAVAQARDGREGEAMRSLREAVKKAVRPRIIRSFLDEGPAVRTLLEKLFKGTEDIASQTVGFGQDLIKAFAAEDRESASHVENHFGDAEDDAPLLPEQLNEREIEIMRMVAGGLSNKEIGLRVGLTEGSVKWYMQTIFTKFDVRRRSQAVLRARKFGII